MLTILYTVSDNWNYLCKIIKSTYSAFQGKSVAICCNKKNRLICYYMDHQIFISLFFLTFSSSCVIRKQTGIYYSAHAQKNQYLLSLSGNNVTSLTIEFVY